MANVSMEIESTSYKHLMKTLDNVGNKYPKEVVRLIHAEGLIIETNAKRNLMSGILEHPHGMLSSSIHSKQSQTGVEVMAKKNYAAYVEFGTGDLVNIPSGWEAFAAKFKGRTVFGKSIH
jgi:ribulose bisphosphate carboxylase small subunit